MISSENRILKSLGLAQRAGKLVSGEFMTEKMIKEGKAFLVVVAEDASSNTKKKFSDMTSYRKLPMLILSDKAGLGHALGRELRASAAVCDGGFAKTILDCFNNGGKPDSEKESI